MSIEKYRSKSVEELTETLKTLSKGGINSTGLSVELREFVCLLKAHKLRHAADAHAFFNCGGMQVLVDLLKHCEVNSQDMVVVLGTVGNICAIDQNSRNFIMQDSDNVEMIIGYLQTSTNSDAVGTTARLLANLALNRAHVLTMHQHAVVAQLSRLLAQGNMDVNCKKNVVRALRLFCSVRECFEELKQSDGISLLLDCFKSDHVELALGALQAIEVMSADADTDVLQWLCNKTTMQCVVRYCNHSKPKVKQRAMNVLLNSVNVPYGRTALSSAGGVETLVAFMESTERNSTIFYKVVHALCTCCRHVNSRQRLRDCGGLERLIHMLADPAHGILHGDIMAALVCYYFDENTLRLMVTKMGLLPTLCYHLKQMTSTSGEVGTHQGGAIEEATLLSETKEETSMDVSETVDVNRQASPSPSDHSPPPSKRPRLDDSPDATPTSFLDSLLSSPNPYQNISMGSQGLNSSLVGNSTLESQVILVVCRVSHMRDCLVTLSYPDTLLSLLNYFTGSSPPNVHISKVLSRIFMNPHCFQNCIVSLVPSKIYIMIRKSDPSSPSEVSIELAGLCKEHIKHISENAESPYGQGVLAHMVLRGSDKEKQASCLSMPLLCRSPRHCQKFMVDYGAFQVLCELLKEEIPSEQWEMALDSMLALGYNMHIQRIPPHHRRRYSALPPQLQVQARKFPFPRLDFSFGDLSLSETDFLRKEASAGDKTSTYCRYLDTDHHPFDLTIVLHSSTGEIVKVPVHKSTLIEESDVFRAMLAGRYKESSCGEVHIHSISPCGFLSVLHHIYGCGWQCRSVLDTISRGSGGNRDKILPPPDLLCETTEMLLGEITSGCEGKEESTRTEHCLQVLACAGRFLLPSLITLCEHAAAKALCPSNLVPMLHFAQLHQCFCLAESCVRALFSHPHLQLRTDLFKELITSTEREAVLQIILLFLTTTDF